MRFFGFEFDKNSTLRHVVDYWKAGLFPQHPAQDLVLSLQKPRHKNYLGGLQAFANSKHDTMDQKPHIYSSVKMDGWFCIYRKGKVFTKSGREFTYWHLNQDGNVKIHYATCYQITLKLPLKQHEIVDLSDDTKNVWTQDQGQFVYEQILNSVLCAVLPVHLHRDTECYVKHLPPQKMGGVHVPRDSPYYPAQPCVFARKTKANDEGVSTEYTAITVVLRVKPHHSHNLRRVNKQALDAALAVHKLQPCLSSDFEEVSDFPVCGGNKHTFMPMCVADYLDNVGDVIFEVVYDNQHCTREEKFHQLNSLLTSTPGSSLKHTPQQLLDAWLQGNLFLYIFEQAHEFFELQLSKKKLTKFREQTIPDYQFPRLGCHEDTTVVMPITSPPNNWKENWSVGWGMTPRKQVTAWGREFHRCNEWNLEPERLAMGENRRLIVQDGTVKIFPEPHWDWQTRLQQIRDRTNIHREEKPGLLMHQQIQLQSSTLEMNPSEQFSLNEKRALNQMIAKVAGNVRVADATEVFTNEDGGIKFLKLQKEFNTCNVHNHEGLVICLSHPCIQEIMGTQSLHMNGNFFPRFKLKKYIDFYGLVSEKGKCIPFATCVDFQLLLLQNEDTERELVQKKKKQESEPLERKFSVARFRCALWDNSLTALTVRNMRHIWRPSPTSDIEPCTFTDRDRKMCPKCSQECIESEHVIMMADKMTSEIWQIPRYVEITTLPHRTCKRQICQHLISNFHKFQALRETPLCKTCAYQQNEEGQIIDLYTAAPMLRFIFGPVLGHTLILWDAKPNSSIDALKKLTLPHCLQDIRLQQQSAQFSLATVQACSHKNKTINPATAEDIYVRTKSNIVSNTGKILVPQNLIGRVVDFLPARTNQYNPKRDGKKVEWLMRDAYEWNEKYGDPVSVCIDFDTDHYWFRPDGTQPLKKKTKNAAHAQDEGDVSNADDMQVDQAKVDAYRREHNISTHDNNETNGLGRVLKTNNPKRVDYHYLKQDFRDHCEITQEFWGQLEIGNLTNQKTKWKPLDAVWGLVNDHMNSHEQKLDCLHHYEHRLTSSRACKNVYWKQKTTRVGLLRTPEIKYVNGNEDIVQVSEYIRHRSKVQPCGVCPVCGLSGDNSAYPIMDRKDVYCELTDDSIDWTKLFIHIHCAKNFIETTFDPAYHEILCRLALTEGEKPDLPEMFKESMQSEMDAVDVDDMDGLLSNNIIDARDAEGDDENDGLARSDNISRTTVVQDENDLVNDILPAIPIDLEFAMSSMCIKPRHNPFLVVL